MNYTYTINGVAVNPTGKWEIEYSRNEGQIFFRRKLRGELTFKGTDYDYIRSLVDDIVSVQNQCTYIDFIIYCDSVEFWTGRFFYPYSFHIDEDSCFMTGTPEVIDEYTCIMNNYETEYDSISVYLSSSIWHTVDVRECAVPFTLIDSFLNVTTFQEFVNTLFEFYLDCTVDIVSSFFYLDEFPGYTAGHYAGIYGTDNYVTGDANHLGYLHIYPNDYVRQTLGGTTCESDSSKISFKIIEEWLRNRFNAYWYIDSEGDFRIEHISYFRSDFPYSDFGPQIDLTALMSGCHSFAERKNKYKYQEDRLYDQEVWEWQHYYGEEGEETHGADFQGAPIYYGPGEGKKTDCIPGEFKEKKISTLNFWTDVYWATQLADPDYIDCDGFLLLDVEIAVPNEKVTCEAGSITAVNQINGHLSTANLQDHYFRWDRIFLHGNMNGVDETFESAIKIKLQDEIEYPNCCDEFDPMKTVTTELGEGAVHAAVQTPYSVKIQLLYD